MVDVRNSTEVNLSVVESEVENRIRNPKERGPFYKLGTLITDASSKFTNRKRHQVQNYLDKIISQIDADTEFFYIIGPSKAKNQLEKELKRHKTFSKKPIVVEPADTMTQRQIVAQVKHFFQKNHA